MKNLKFFRCGKESGRRLPKMGRLKSENSVIYYITYRGVLLYVIKNMHGFNFYWRDNALRSALLAVKN